jgi:hypothetical protein
MTANKLKLNDSKTEVMVVSSAHNQASMKDTRLKIGEDTITPKPVVRNLGGNFDYSLSMDKQVSAVVQKMYYNIRRIAKVRHHLTQETCAKAINATVISHLDYHNGLLLGISEQAIHRLQVAQNSAARLLTRTPYRQHITPVLQHLHWLPVRQRITFKVLTTIQKTLHTATAPSYLRELCPVYHPGRALRSSSDQHKLTVKKANNKYGTRSMRTLGAKLWNELPLEMRREESHQIFRKRLKTLLYRHEY